MLFLFVFFLEKERVIFTTGLFTPLSSSQYLLKCPFFQFVAFLSRVLVMVSLICCRYSNNGQPTMTMEDCQCIYVGVSVENWMSVLIMQGVLQ